MQQIPASPMVSFRSLALASLALISTATPVAADAILQVSGSTLGCYGDTCTSFGYTTSYTGYELSFSGTTFDVFTDTSGSVLDFELGSMQRGNTRISNSSAPLPFTLEVLFTLPTGIDGSEGDTFSALITGTNYGGGGKVDVDFDNTWQLLTFSTASGYGSFEFSVLNDFLLNNNGDGSILGGIRNATYTSTLGTIPIGEGGGEGEGEGGGEGGGELDPQTPEALLPEPAMLLLFGAGLAAGLRRRLRMMR